MATNAYIDRATTIILSRMNTGYIDRATSVVLSVSTSAYLQSATAVVMLRDDDKPVILPDQPTLLIHEY